MWEPSPGHGHHPRCEEWYSPNGNSDQHHGESLCKHQIFEQSETRGLPWNECVILLDCWTWEKQSVSMECGGWYDKVGVWYVVLKSWVWYGWVWYVGLRAPKAPFQTTSYHYDPSRLGEMYGMRKKRLRLSRKCRTMITNCHICFNTHLSSILIGLPGSCSMRASSAGLCVRENYFLTLWLDL